MNFLENLSAYYRNSLAVDGETPIRIQRMVELAPEVVMVHDDFAQSCEAGEIDMYFTKGLWLVEAGVWGKTEAEYLSPPRLAMFGLRRIGNIAFAPRPLTVEDFAAAVRRLKTLRPKNKKKADWHSSPKELVVPADLRSHQMLISA